MIPLLCVRDHDKPSVSLAVFNGSNKCRSGEASLIGSEGDNYCEKDNTVCFRDGCSLLDCIWKRHRAFRATMGRLLNSLQAQSRVKV